MSDEYADSAVDSSSARTRSAAFAACENAAATQVSLPVVQFSRVLDSLHFELITGR